MTYKYFLSATLGNETHKAEVSLEEYCKAERSARFRPKLPSTDPKYMTTPATGGFSNELLSGSMEWQKEPA